MSLISSKITKAAEITLHTIKMVDLATFTVSMITAVICGQLLTTQILAQV